MKKEKPSKNGIKIGATTPTKVKGVADTEGGLLYVLDANDNIIGVRDFYGNIYNQNGEIVGHIDD